MGFRIHRGIFQKLNAERTAYENTFKIDTDGRIKEVDSEGEVVAGYLKVGEQATDADTVDGFHATNAAGGLVVLNSSNGYWNAPSWVHFNEGRGIYSSHNGAHLLPNNQGQYGAWRMIGTRNGWEGLHFGDANGVTLMMNQSESGLHRNGTGWKYRHQGGKFYVHDGTNGGGTAREVWHTGNFSATDKQLLLNTLQVTSLPYTCDIVLNGDPDTYYPVHFFGGNQDVWRRIIIRRGYGEQAPWDPIGTGAHRGGLLLDWEGNFGGWGGAQYSDRLRVLNESYTNVVADMYRTTHSMGYTFFLRGGGDTGAIYHIYSDQSINGYGTTGVPQVGYSTDTLFYNHNNASYRVYAPAALSASQINSSRLNGLKTQKRSETDSLYLTQDQGDARYLQSVPSTYATTSYVDTAVSNLVDSAPGALNTLNELAAALGDDANFSTTVTNAIASKADSSHTHGIGDITNATRWWNNFGDNHDTRTSFDAQGSSLTTGFGWRYIQGNGNGPGTDSSPNQFYGLTVGLGNDYNYDNYGMQLVIPRNTATPYISVRFEEGRSLGAWQKISAGYADSAGAVAWSNVSGKPSTFAPSSHNHNDIYYTETEVDNLIGTRAPSSHTHVFIKPYREYGSYIRSSDTPLTLKTEMGGGGLRVDFMNGASFNTWSHVITWSGYDGYNMYQLAGNYGGSDGTAPDLYVRTEPNHARNSWSDWKKLWSESHFSGTEITNWNTAYGWGNHASAGYLTSLPSHTHDDRYFRIDSTTSRGPDFDALMPTTNRTYYKEVHAINEGSNIPTGAYTYGVVQSTYMSSMKLQWYVPHTASRGNAGVTDTIYFRTNWGSGNWYGWKYLIHSGNIGEQSVNYAGSAGAVAWDNVTGKPSTFAPSSHTHSHITNNPSGTESSSLHTWDRQESTPDLNPTTDWFNALRIGHGNPVTYYSNTLAIQMTGGDLGRIYTRTISNGTKQSWNKYWHGGDFSSTNISNWNTAYGWGNHATAGYVTSVTDALGYTPYQEGTALSASTIDAGSKVKVQAGHNDARMVIAYNHSGDSTSEYSGNLVMWTSEPGISYPGSGIGGNVHESGHYYGKRNANIPFGVALRFNVTSGRAEFLATNSTNNGSFSVGWYVDDRGNTVQQGSITAPGYNSGNWDTAYGWGNHASAGYLTSVPNLAASKITSGTFANARISQSSVTQHQSALSIAASQVSGLPASAAPVATTVEGGEDSTLASIHFNPDEGAATFTLANGSTYRLAFAR